MSRQRSPDKALIGISCVVAYYDSPEGFADAYISFSEELFNDEGEPAEKDIHGVPDDRIFFYLAAEQQKALISVIAEDKDKFHTEEEWFIDLSEGFTLVYE